MRAKRGAADGVGEIKLRNLPCFRMKVRGIDDDEMRGAIFPDGAGEVFGSGFAEKYPGAVAAGPTQLFQLFGDENAGGVVPSQFGADDQDRDFPGALKFFSQRRFEVFPEERLRL